MKRTKQRKSLSRVFYKPRGEGKKDFMRYVKSVTVPHPKIKGETQSVDMVHLYAQEDGFAKEGEYMEALVPHKVITENFKKMQQDIDEGKALGLIEAEDWPREMETVQMVEQVLFEVTYLGIRPEKDYHDYALAIVGTFTLEEIGFAPEPEPETEPEVNPETGEIIYQEETPEAEPETEPEPEKKSPKKRGLLNKASKFLSEDVEI